MLHTHTDPACPRPGDHDFDGIVFVDAPSYVVGRGLMRITAGVGTCTLSSNKGGQINLFLTSGGHSHMEPLPCLPVIFDGAEPRALRFRGHGDDSQRMAGQRVEVNRSSAAAQ
jgi:hypothetical protein